MMCLNGINTLNMYSIHSITILVAPTDVFSVNDGFSSKLYRVKVQAGMLIMHITYSDDLIYDGLSFHHLRSHYW